jgi:hypothetical protein
MAFASQADGDKHIHCSGTSSGDADAFCSLVILHIPSGFESHTHHSHSLPIPGCFWVVQNTDAYPCKELTDRFLGAGKYARRFFLHYLT